MTQREAFEAQIETFLADFDEDEQERVLRYAIDHIVPRLKKQAAQFAAPRTDTELINRGCRYETELTQAAAPAYNRDAVVVNLMRLANIDKHLARDIADAAFGSVGQAAVEPVGYTNASWLSNQHAGHFSAKKTEWFNVPLYTSPPDHTAEIERLKKEISTLDVLLEECKMDWSGDVTQIKAEHKHEIERLTKQCKDFAEAEYKTRIEAQATFDHYRETMRLALELFEALNNDENYDHDGCFQHWDKYDLDAAIAALEGSLNRV